MCESFYLPYYCTQKLPIFVYFTSCPDHNALFCAIHYMGSLDALSNGFQNIGQIIEMQQDSELKTEGNENVGVICDILFTC